MPTCHKNTVVKIFMLVGPLGKFYFIIIIYVLVPKQLLQSNKILLFRRYNTSNLKKFGL